MEDSKLQRLHDTLKKLAPKGNHGGLGSAGLVRGGFKHKDNGLPKNGLYSYFVKPGHFKKTFDDSDAEENDSEDEKQKKAKKLKRKRAKEEKAEKKAQKKLAKKLKAEQTTETDRTATNGVASTEAGRLSAKTKRKRPKDSPGATAENEDASEATTNSSVVEQELNTEQKSAKKRKRAKTLKVDVKGGTKPSAVESQAVPLAEVKSNGNGKEDKKRKRAGQSQTVAEGLDETRENAATGDGEECAKKKQKKTKKRKDDAQETSGITMNGVMPSAKGSDSNGVLGKGGEKSKKGKKSKKTSAKSEETNGVVHLEDKTDLDGGNKAGDEDAAVSPKKKGKKRRKDDGEQVVDSVIAEATKESKKRTAKKAKLLEAASPDLREEEAEKGVRGGVGVANGVAEMTKKQRKDKRAKKGKASAEAS